MKKNISVISMDSVLQEWLLQKLIKEPPESDSAKELLSGIYDMVSGEVNSLLLMIFLLINNFDCRSQKHI